MQSEDQNYTMWPSIWLNYFKLLVSKIAGKIVPAQNRYEDSIKLNIDVMSRHSCHGVPPPSAKDVQNVWYIYDDMFTLPVKFTPTHVFLIHESLT